MALLKIHPARLPPLPNILPARNALFEMQIKGGGACGQGRLRPKDAALRATVLYLVHQQARGH